jgi:hypothetical protein
MREAALIDAATPDVRTSTSRAVISTDLMGARQHHSTI